MRLLLIVNPSASSVTPRTSVLIRRALSMHHEVTLAETAQRGHATRLAQRAAQEGHDVVVVLGGDGTLNEAANGLVGGEIPLAALPGGSTNVFARTIGFPNDPVAATGELLSALDRHSRASIGLGCANGRYFLFHVGIGFDAAVVERVERRSSLKRYAGHPFFVWSTLLTWARWNEQRTPRFAVHYPDGEGSEERLDGFLTICMNSNPYTFLGSRPFNIVPDQAFEDGFSLLTLTSLGLPTFGGVIAAALMSRQGIRSTSRADLRTHVSTCRVTGYGPFPYQLDGDYLGDVEELHLEHHPNALQVIMPAERRVIRSAARPRRALRSS